MQIQAAAASHFLQPADGLCVLTRLYAPLISSTSRAYLVENWGMLLFSNIIAFVVGMLAIDFVLKFLKKEGSLEKFGWYRVILATIIIIFELIK